MVELGTVEIRREDDIVRAHQTTRSIAASLGYSNFEQTRIATAMSEIARNALLYAGGGTVELGLDEESESDGRTRRSLEIVVRDHGPGISDLDSILRGERISPSGLGLGIPGSRRLMDSLAVDTGPMGTRVVMTKQLPRRRPTLELSALRARVADQHVNDPYQEIQRLQRDIALRDQELAQLARELDETNRGVLALTAELEQRAEYQREASELKMRLMSEMGHELRTPLHSIVSISQFLLDRLDGELTSEQERQVRLIRDVGVTTTNYINDLLDLSKAQAGKFPVHARTFSVVQLLNTLRRIMQPLASDPAVALRFEPVPDVPLLFTDESKLSQILRNLISNALKYTVRGHVDVRVWPSDEETVTFEVRDTGLGIDRANFETIFEDFTRLEGARHIRGTGLGLPLSSRLAELLGGWIELDSELGVGSQFRLVVPIHFKGEVSSEKPNVDIGAESVTIAEVAQNRPRLLLIDDDEASRYVLRRWLEERYSITEASCGLDGVLAAASHPPDAIFLDVVMPDLTGFEVLERLGADPRTAHVPVIVYSALALGTDDRLRLARASSILRKSTASRVADRAAVEEALARAGVANLDIATNVGDGSHD